MPNKFPMIRANAPEQIRCVSDAQLTITAAKNAGDGDTQPTFSMVAYTGDVMAVGWYGDVVIDLSGISIPDTIPILYQHNPNTPIAHATDVSVIDNQLVAAGVFSGYGVTQRAKEVVNLAKNGFPWQASVGVAPITEEKLKAGETAEVNGRTISGPVFIARTSKLLEISVVVNGADDKTSTQVAASAAQELSQEEDDMNFTEWLKARGIAADKLSDAERNILKATFEAEQQLAAQENAGDDPDESAPAPVPVVSGTATRAATAPDLSELNKTISELRAAQREITIRAKCGEHTTVADAAIKHGWSDEVIDAKLELARIQARTTFAFPSVNTGRGAPALNASMIEASILLNTGTRSGRYPERRLIAEYGEDVVTEAAKLRIQGFRQLFTLMAQVQGVNLPFAASQQDFIKAAFSNLSLSDGILSNTANKQLLDAYQSIDNAWESIANTSNVNDFKTHTRYRLTGSMTYEKVAADGELKHGELDEQSYTQRIDTYGKMFAITRQDLINDDLNALSDIARRLGMGAALALNKVFWTLFLGSESAGFFASGNGNLDSGSNALGYSGLAAAELLFLNQTLPVADQDDSVSHPLAIDPAILLVPNALWATARRLMASTKLNETTTADTPSPDQNIYAGAYQVVKTPYLSNSGLTGYSAAAWYLAADPNVLAGFDVAFLNGQRTPVVESADVDFSQLGIQFRGYHDFGVARLDPRAIVKMNP